MKYEPGSYRAVLKEAVTSVAETGSAQIVLTLSISQFWDGTQWRTAHRQDRRVYLSLHENAWPSSRITATAW